MFDITKIFGFFKKNFSKKDCAVIIILISLYFFSRIVNLTKLPIFCDEGIYIRWAKVAWHDASWRFISLTDGKQPLQTWVTIPFLKLFPNDMLMAGRLFAVIGGFISFVGIFSLLFYLFGKNIAFIGSLFYIFTPYFLFYERMALVDSWVNAGAVWILFSSIMLVKNRRLDLSLFFGFIGGFFLLAKSSVQMFLMLSVFAPIIILQKNLKKLFIDSVNYYFLFGISLVIALIIYNVQRLSPFFQFVSLKNLIFVMSFSEFLKTPFQYFFHNIKYLPLYVSWEMGFILSLYGLLGLFLLFKKEKKLASYLFLWVALPFTALCFFTKVLFPRYLIFFSSLLLIPASYFIFQFKKPLIRISLVLIFFLSILYFDYTILFSQKNIPFPDVDRGQYLEGWTAGWGIKDIVDFAREKSKTKPVIIMAEGNFGMAGDTLDVTLKKDDKISIKGYWPLDEKQLKENQPFLKDNYIYIVFVHRVDFPENWPMKLVNKYEKPGGKEKIYLFELTK